MKKSASMTTALCWLISILAVIWIAQQDASLEIRVFLCLLVILPSVLQSILEGMDIP